MCFEGPEETLRQTVNAQPALLTTSIAAWTVLVEEIGGPPQAVMFAGHSLGEYSALVAAGALSFEAGIKLVQERGRLMQEAGDARTGSMAAVLGLDDTNVELVCTQAQSGGIVTVANYNAPGQIVISGELPAIERASQLAKGAGARRVLPLAVSGAFHSPLMEQAAEGLRPMLNESTFKSSNHRIFANVTGLCYASVGDIPATLVRQVVSPVRWTGCIQGMVAGGVDTFVEIGPSQVLTGLIKRIHPKVATMSASNSDNIKEYITWHRGQGYS
jgi:[acyl-carrier-protein] S-malonyltransferase